MTRHAPTTAIVLLLVAAVAACATDQRRAGHGPHGGRSDAHAARGVFISPMGEPFRGPGDREALIAHWFDGADSDNDGRVTLAEFRADALRFFRTLDTNGDGQIDPDELRHYESAVAPEIRVGDAGSGGGAGRPAGGHGGHGRHGGRGGGGGSEGDGGAPAQSGGGEGAQGAARFGFFDLPEPVASADADFNRSITAAEFAAAATRRFALLDTNGDGALARSELPKAGRGAR